MSTSFQTSLPQLLSIKKTFIILAIVNFLLGCLMLFMKELSAALTLTAIGTIMMAYVFTLKNENEPRVNSVRCFWIAWLLFFPVSMLAFVGSLAYQNALFVAGFMCLLNVGLFYASALKLRNKTDTYLA